MMSKILKNEYMETNAFTWIAMIVGTLALTGFPFLSGYYSKDAIIEFAYLRGTNVGYFAASVGILTAFM